MDKKTIFLVDDTFTNLVVAEAALVEQYRVVSFSSAAQMFDALEKLRAPASKPDLILLDVKMPGMSGFEAMEKLQENPAYSNIPVIFLTGITDAELEAKGIELGAVDFVTKPFTKPVLLNRIKRHLHIEEIVRAQTSQLVQLQSGIVYILADLTESRDKSTGGHIDRTTVYIKILIEALLEKGVYADEISRWNLKSVVSSARLHDIGKIIISDVILNKPGSLTDEEFEIMKTHTSIGELIIDRAIQRTGNAEFLHNAKMIATFHHERWDGTGYPYGFEGSDIPLLGRIMAVVDVYDALASDRPYKKAFPHEKAMEIIAENSGTHFEPQIARVFCDISDRIKSARQEFENSV